MESNENVRALLTFHDALIGLPLSHLWRGHGSAIFLEFGRLTPTTRRTGVVGNPNGEMGPNDPVSWRIENRTSIVCGSWSEERLWEPTFDLLRNRSIVDLSVMGRLPEVVVALAEDRYVSSFMTAEGDPSWALFDRRSDSLRTLNVRGGILNIDVSPDD
jgi:hypothetical protein